MIYTVPNIYHQYFQRYYKYKKARYQDHFEMNHIKRVLNDDKLLSFKEREGTPMCLKLLTSLDPLSALWH